MNPSKISILVQSYKMKDILNSEARRLPKIITVGIFNK